MGQNHCARDMVIDAVSAEKVDASVLYLIKKMEDKNEFIL